MPELRARNEPDEADKRKAILTAKLDPNKDKKIPDLIASFLVPNSGEIIESKRATEKPKNATERLKQRRKEGLSRG